MAIEDVHKLRNDRYCIGVMIIYVRNEFLMNDGIGKR